MKKIVVDTSVAVKWINQQDENLITQANKLLKDNQEGKVNLLMPELAKYEVGNAILNKQMLLPQTLRAITAYYSFPIDFVPQDASLEAATIEIACLAKITYYDAIFIALSKREKAALITDNVKDHTKYKGKDVLIIPLEKYK